MTSFRQFENITVFRIRVKVKVRVRFRVRFKVRFRVRFRVKRNAFLVKRVFEKV